MRKKGFEVAGQQFRIKRENQLQRFQGKIWLFKCKTEILMPQECEFLLYIDQILVRKLEI